MPGFSVRRLFVALLSFLNLAALQGCAMSMGNGVTLGEKDKREVATPKLDWTSWDAAQRSANTDRRPILLFVKGKPQDGSAEFDASLFDEEDVKLICREASCVRLSAGSKETVFSNKLGVSLLLPSGELQYQFETTPARDAFITAVRRTVIAASPRVPVEPRIRADLKPTLK